MVLFRKFIVLAVAIVALIVTRPAAVEEPTAAIPGVLIHAAGTIREGRPCCKRSSSDKHGSQSYGYAF